jgi:glycosyltransferase involved in cell wall biosynthesis
MDGPRVCIISPNFRDPNRQYEGRTKMIARLYSFLKDRGVNVSVGLKRECDVIHINSSGIFEALKYIRVPRGKKVYTLYSNLKTKPINVLRDTVDFLRIRNPKLSENSIWRIFYRTLFTLMTSILPWGLLRVLFERTVGVVVLSNHYTRKRLGSWNSRIVRVGIDIEDFEKCGKKRGEPVVAYVGHPSPSKGLLEAIEILKNVRGAKKALYLSNPNRIRVEALLGKEPIEIHGPQKDLKRMYSTIDVLILPYRHELSSIATPLVLLEAMACGTAIVSSRLPHIVEAGGDTVLYALPGDVKGFVELANYLLENPKVRRKLGRKARARVKRLYRIDENLRRYTDVYGVLLNEPPQSPGRHRVSAFQVR